MIKSEKMRTIAKEFSRIESDCAFCESKDALCKERLEYRILPETGEDEFIRAAWICLARQDAPLDIFDCDFNRVETVERKVVADAAKAKISCGDAGERFEGFEKSDCVAESSAYVESGRTKRALAISDDDLCGLGECDEKESVSSFDDGAFERSFESMRGEPVAVSDAEAANTIKVAPDCRWNIERKHDEDFSIAASEVLCDAKKSEGVYECKITEKSARIYVVPEYRATITYKGKAYTLRAFAFGDAIVSGDKIENRYSLRECENKKRKKLDVEKKKIEKSCADKKMSRGKRDFFAPMILFALSVIGCLAVGAILAIFGPPVARSASFWETLALLAASVFSFIVAIALAGGMIRKIRRDEAADEKAKEEIEILEEAATASMDRFAASYEALRLACLNDKLESLGLDTATAEEAFEQRERRNGRF